MSKVEEEEKRVVKLQILSDLHLEFPTAPKRIPKIPVVAPILILAGDIGSARKDSLENYLREVSKNYELVLYVLGNHEFYGLEYNRGRRVHEDICDKFDNVIYMHMKSLVKDGIRYIGTTLWSFVPNDKIIPVANALNDYRMIKRDVKGQDRRDLMVPDTNEFFKEELEYIKTEIDIAKKNEEKVVVITHHAPLMTGCSHPKFNGSPANNAFQSDLKYLIKDPIIAWVSGHTHYSAKLEVDGIPVVSNQLGYVTFQEKAGFDPDYVLKLEY